MVFYGVGEGNRPLVVSLGSCQKNSAAMRLARKITLPKSNIDKRTIHMYIGKAVLQPLSFSVNQLRTKQMTVFRISHGGCFSFTSRFSPSSFLRLLLRPCRQSLRYDIVNVHIPV